MRDDLPDIGSRSVRSVGVPGGGTVPAKDGTMIEWSTSDDGTVTAVGADNAKMVLSSHGPSLAEEVVTRPQGLTSNPGQGPAGVADGPDSERVDATTLASSAASTPDPTAAETSYTRLEFSVKTGAPYLTIGLRIDKTARIISLEAATEQTELTLEVPITATAPVPATASGSHNGTPISWRGEIDPANASGALADVPGWSSDPFLAAGLEAIYFEPVLDLIPASTAELWDKQGRGTLDDRVDITPEDVVDIVILAFVVSFSFSPEGLSVNTARWLFPKLGRFTFNMVSYGLRLGAIATVWVKRRAVAWVNGLLASTEGGAPAFDIPGTSDEPLGPPSYQVTAHEPPFTERVPEETFPDPQGPDEPPDPPPDPEPEPKPPDPEPPEPNEPFGPGPDGGEPA